MKNKYAALVKFMLHKKPSHKKTKFYSNYIFKYQDNWFAINEYALIKLSNFDVMDYKKYLIQKLKKQSQFIDKIPNIYDRINKDSVVCPILANGNIWRIIDNITYFYRQEDEILNIILNNEIGLIFPSCMRGFIDFVSLLHYDNLVKEDIKEDEFFIETHYPKTQDKNLVTNSNLLTLIRGIESCEKTNDLLRIYSKPLHLDNMYELRDEKDIPFMWFMGN